MGAAYTNETTLPAVYSQTLNLCGDSRDRGGRAGVDEERKGGGCGLIGDHGPLQKGGIRVYAGYYRSSTWNGLAQH